MQSDIHKKLEEAVFFHGKLIDSAENFESNAIYYFSAFLSALQSTVFIMEKEFGSDKQYKENPFMKSELHLKFNRVRHVIIHQEVPNLRHRIETSFGPQGLVVGGGQTVNIPLKPFAGLMTPISVEQTDSAGKKHYSEALQTRDLYISLFDTQRGVRQEILFSSFLAEAREYLQSLINFVEEVVH